MGETHAVGNWCVASKFGRPSKKGETQENKAKSYTRPLLKPVNRARINTNKCLDYISFLTVKKGKNSTTSINTLFVEFFY